MQHFAEDLDLGSRAVRPEQADERMRVRHLLIAFALHVVAIFGALLMPGAFVDDEGIVTVELVLQGGGEAGASGGTPSSAPIGGTPEAQPAAQVHEVEPEPPTPVVAPPRAKPVPRPAPPQPKAEVALAEPAPPPPVATAPSVASRVGVPSGEIGQGNSGPAGVGHGTAGEGMGAFGAGEGPGDEYLERVRRYIAQYKNYPDTALEQKQQGTVTVEFVLARDGTVLEARIDRSSGFEILDRATLDMMRRASPVPPVPARYAGDRLKIALPIDYKIGFFGRMF